MGESATRGIGDDRLRYRTDCMQTAQSATRTSSLSRFGCASRSLDEPQRRGLLFSARLGPLSPQFAQKSTVGGDVRHTCWFARECRLLSSRTEWMHSDKQAGAQAASFLPL